jgi:GNAT superfamily N-acetyltransferase
MNLKMQCILSKDEVLFAKAHHLLKNSFIPDEITDFRPELFNIPDFFMYAALLGDQFVGTTTFWDLQECVFIGYIVIDPLQRGRTLGSQVLQWLLDFRSEKIHVGEVDLPSSEIAIRRLDFFQRHGFKVNDFDYFQPALAPYKSPVHLRMISHPHLLKRIIFERIHREIYQEVYSRLI